MENLGLTSFAGVYAGRRVLVTGHTGFKGSWLTMWLRALGARVAGLALAPDTEPSHWSLLALDDVSDHRVNLCDAAAVQAVLQAEQPEIVFHLAAQSLVRRSYREPAATFSSNVTGLVNLFEAVRATGSVRVLVNATTDKVYAEYDAAGGYRETDALGGHDPYSTSKACAELVSECYRKSFFGGPESPVRIATARAGNVIGGGDWGLERLVPDLVRAATAGQQLRVRNPSAIRPWQHVLEPLSGYLRLAQRLLDTPELAGAWNFGPGGEGEISVESLVERLGAHWDAIATARDTGRHPHEAATLRLDASKARSQLSWRPVWGIDTTIARTAAWYRTADVSPRSRSLDDLVHYVTDARRLGVGWAT